MTNAIQSKPMPNVTVTKPAMDKDAAFQTLFGIVAALPVFMESQNAMSRLTEACFWLNQAITVKNMHDEQQARARKAHEANAVREKVDLKQ